MVNEVTSIALMMAIIGLGVVFAVIFASPILLYASVIAFVITVMYSSVVLLHYLLIGSGEK